MAQAFKITEETYQLYTELATDYNRPVLELEDVIGHYLLMDRPEETGYLWWMTESRFNEKWKIIEPATETSFAVITHK